MSDYNWSEIMSKKETSELEAIIRNKNFESEEKVTVTQKDKYTTTNIKIKNSGSDLNLQEPWNNEVLEKFKKEAYNVKITILKTIFSNEYIAVLRAIIDALENHGTYLFETGTGIGSVVDELKSKMNNLRSNT